MSKRPPLCLPSPAPSLLFSQETPSCTEYLEPVRRVCEFKAGNAARVMKVMFCSLTSSQAALPPRSRHQPAHSPTDPSIKVVGFHVALFNRMNATHDKTCVPSKCRSWVCLDSAFRGHEAGHCREAGIRSAIRTLIFRHDSPFTIYPLDLRDEPPFNRNPAAHTMAIVSFESEARSTLALVLCAAAKRGSQNVVLRMKYNARCARATKD